MDPPRQRRPFSHPAGGPVGSRAAIQMWSGAVGDLQHWRRRSCCPCSRVSAQAANVGNYTAGERKRKESCCSLLSALLSLSLSLFVPPHKRGIIRYMLAVLMGGVISLAQLTVCKVHFFLKSKEHDLFSLLFWSDLIGHSSHIYEWHLYQRYQRNFKVKCYPPVT